MGLPIVSLFYLPVISLIKRYTGRTFNPFGNIKEILREEMSLKVTLFLFVFKVVRYSFLGPIYLPSLSINYVAINKVLEKLPPQLY